MHIVRFICRVGARKRGLVPVNTRQKSLSIQCPFIFRRWRPHLWAGDVFFVVVMLHRGPKFIQRRQPFPHRIPRCLRMYGGACILRMSRERKHLHRYVRAYTHAHLILSPHTHIQLHGELHTIITKKEKRIYVSVLSYVGRRKEPRKVTATLKYNSSVSLDYGWFCARAHFIDR